MEFAWTAPDGEQFPCEEWPAAAAATGVLVCVPGMGGAASDFAPVAGAATAAGFATYAVNLRGQGRDRAPRRGAWLDLPSLGRDLNAFCEMAVLRHPGVPLFVCGESMGSLVVAWQLAKQAIRLPVQGVIFSVPVVELTKPTPWLTRQILRVLARLLPLSTFSPAWFVNGKSEPLRITRDEGHHERLRQSPHYIRTFSFRFLNSLGNLIESSSALAQQVETPCLVLAAGQDVFLRTEQVEAWFAKLRSEDKTLLVYPEAYHLLWHDFDRDEVLADIIGWLKERA